ncbi:hypothetical protein AJ80_03170 [Polytolypa hystricis UAMH7299]|uniref:Uncharacterized protein n=1 Tax=Polytolypa hystricis (strain UAMH7299) TaxID=1447883 RepID=A0A2B7YKX6_POLH7|nr:hypothetical protein AJ80_03170 [Polytolypa hystricis UAMH7299]
MRASSSKRVAVRVLSACQQVGEDDEIVGILLHDETKFQLRYNHLLNSREGDDVRRSLANERLQTIRSLWEASEPRLQPAIRRFLYDGYQNPRKFLEKSAGNLPQEIAVNNYLESLYHVGQNRQIETVQWRIGLIPLSDLAEKFNRTRVNTETHHDLVTILSQSGLVFQHEDEIRKSLPSWLLKSKRYKILATTVGYGGIASLPVGPGDLLWERDLPQKGPVHEACMNLLVDAGIKEAASENVAEDDQRILTASTAAETMVRYISSLFDKFPFLNYQPQGPLRHPEAARGNGRRQKDHTQHVDACDTRRSESQSESRRPNRL